MKIRTILLLLVSAAPLLMGGCDLGGPTGTPVTSDMVPHASNNPYTNITNSILGIYNGLQSSNPTYGNISGTTGGSQSETSSQTGTGTGE